MVNTNIPKSPQPQYCGWGHYKWIQVLLGVLCLLVGISIYLLFRSENITLYRWMAAIGITDAIAPLRHSVSLWDVPPFVRFSLPDGLYCLSYILLMDAVWQRSRRPIRLMAASLIPLITITHELLQAAGLARGTFDWSDLLCYALPLIGYWLLSKRWCR
jgi:hypothetical protein